MVGVPVGDTIVLTKVSGRHGLRARLDDMGAHVTAEDFERVFEAFKELADRKDEVDDRDLMAILSEQTASQIDDHWKLDLVQVSTSDHGSPTATVRLIGPDGEPKEDAAIGSGPVDAIYQAINRVTGVAYRLTEFSVKSVTEGIDAQGEVSIRIEADGATFLGRASDTDILVASARAYVHALNRYIHSAATSPKVAVTP